MLNVSDSMLQLGFLTHFTLCCLDLFIENRSFSQQELFLGTFPQQLTHKASALRAALAMAGILLQPLPTA